MFPSTPPETGRDRRTDGNRAAPDDWTDQPDPAERPRRRRAPDPADSASGTSSTADADDEAGHDPSDEEEVEIVPIRRLLSLAVGGFAVLLGVGLIFGAHTAGPGARIPFAVVIFGVQALYVLAWTMATRPPTLPAVAGIALAVAVGVDLAAATTTVAGLGPLIYIALAGCVAAIIAQVVRPDDRARVKESLGATLLTVFGVASFASLIVLTRLPLGTQSILVCLAAAAVALGVARFTDAALPWPRLAPQVPRAAAGVVLGAMLGTLTSGVIGIKVLGFTPTSGAVIGLVAAATAVLADLGTGYAEAGRQMAGEEPTMWIARHMQGPLWGFALAAPSAYLITVILG